MRQQYSQLTLKAMLSAEMQPDHVELYCLLDLLLSPLYGQIVFVTKLPSKKLE